MMKKQILMLMCCTTILSVNAVFAMEDLPEGPKSMTAVQRNDALPDDDVVGPIHSLPPEDLDHIFSFVSSRSELIPFSLVSRDWNEVANYTLTKFPYSLIVMGRLGAGKSTLVHLLAGKSSHAKKKGRSAYEFRFPDPLPNVTIEHRPKAGTTEPIKVLDSSHKRIIWDCPAFSRNLSKEEDFANAQKIHSFLKGDIKVIYLIEEHSFNLMYGSTVLESLHCLTEIFPDQNQLQGLLTLVISKRTTEYGCHSQELMGYVKEHNANDYSTNGLALLQHLIDNPSQVIDFPEPQQDGAYVINERLLSLINDQSYVSNPQVNAPTQEDVNASRWNTKR